MVTLRLIEERETDMEIEERKMEMEVGDCSLWHYLIFCEEFVNYDSKNDVVCWVCEESVLGHPFFKCLECAFVQHKSCPQLPHLTEMDVKHDITNKHHLILQEETEDDAKKKVLCAGCGKLESSLAYKCSIPNCAFYLHKSCDQLSHAKLHYAHPNHTLVLALPPFHLHCDLCSKDRRRRRTTLVYRCHLCKFFMDNKCASRWDIIENERKMEATDGSIWHYLIFCQQFMSDDYKDNVVCWVCEQLVSGYPAFKCLECSFVQHKSCTQLPDLTEMNIWHDANDRHHLILQETEDDSEKKVVCAGCGKPSSSPSYRCSIPQCAFHLHKSCDQLSHAILHNAHPGHTLILSFSPFGYSCNVCSKDRKKRTTLLYHCYLCYFHMDIKCASHRDIIESEIKMENEDCSIWHYLICCEEFMSDDCKNDMDCWVCEEAVSGHPTFKCLECNFVQHKSCSQLPDAREMHVEHDIGKRHHLTVREETENNEKEEAVCGGCGKIASGPAYRCSIPRCTFHLHKSCDRLSHAIEHIVHSDHILFLRLPSPTVCCDLCAKDRRINPLLYGCRLCNFDVDIECVSRWRITVNNCHAHAFIASRKPNKFTCEACGEETEDIVYQCSDCRVLTHRWCSQFQATIRICTHHHPFSRTYCLRQVTTVEKAICKLCCCKVNTECGGYYCQQCDDYTVHMDCAERNKSPNFEATEFDDYVGHLVYLIEGSNVEKDKTAGTPLEINHYSHPQHQLVLSHKDPGNDKQLFKKNKRCEACMQFIVFPPFYSCEDCDIFFHWRCVELPRTIRRLPFDQNIQTLSSSLPSTDRLFWCWMCKCDRHGFFYESKNRRCDIQCFLIPETVSHESHGHSLHVHVQSNLIWPWRRRICIGCGWPIHALDQHLMCSECEFYLCFKCATFPMVARYKYHPHLLKLTYTYENNSEESYCLICEEKLVVKSWFYSCKDCDFTAHIQCVIGSSLKSGRHEHPVILAQKHMHSPKCYLCEKSLRFDKQVLECPQCKFSFHFKCYYQLYS